MKRPATFLFPEKLIFLFVIFLSPVLAKAQSPRIEIRSDSLFINSTNIRKETALNDIHSALGKPDRKTSLANIIWTYDDKGIRIYIDTAHQLFSVISLDLKKEDYNFSPAKAFSGDLIIYGVRVSRATPIADLLKIKAINFRHSVMDLYSAPIGNLKLLFDYSRDKRSMETFSIWFMDEEDRLMTAEEKKKKVVDSSVYYPDLLPIKIINRDTVISHYVNGKYGEPGYRAWDSVKIWADIILPGYPDNHNNSELKKMVLNIMRQNNIDHAEVFRTEGASKLFRLSSLRAYKALKESGDYLGKFEQ